MKPQRRSSRDQGQKPSKNYNSQYFTKGGSPLRQSGLLSAASHIGGSSKELRSASKPMVESRIKRDLKMKIRIKEEELIKMINSANEVAQKVSHVQDPRSTESLAKPRTTGAYATEVSQAEKIARARAGLPEQITRTNMNIQAQQYSTIQRKPSQQERHSSKAAQKLTEKILHVSPLRFSNSHENTKSAQQLQSIGQIYQQAMQLTTTIQKRKEGKRQSPLRYNHDRSKQPYMTASAVQLPEVRFDEPERDTRPDYPERDSNRLILKPTQVPINKLEEEIQSLQHSKKLSNFDRINVLNSDIIALHRKINMIRLDIDRVKQEKNDVQTHLYLGQTRTQDLNHQIDEEDDDIEARNIKGQIAVEKRENEQLHERIQMINRQKKETGSQISNVISVCSKDDAMTRRINMELTQKDQDIEVVYRQKDGVIDQTKTQEAQLIELTAQQLDLYHELKKLEKMRENLARQKNKLHDDLEEQTKEFQVKKYDLRENLKSIELTSDFFSKQVASRVIFGQLQIFQSNQIQASFNEIKRFSSFDQKCIKGLKDLSRAIHKAGRLKLQWSLYRWYKNCLHPTGLKKQNTQIASWAKNSALMNQCFFAWKEHHKQRLDTYKAKTDSIMKIWDKMNSYALQEKKRALQIWKQKLNFGDHKTVKCRKLLMKAYKKRLALAMLRWRKYSIEVFMQCKIHLLKQEYAQKFYLNTMFQQLKEQTFLSRRWKWRCKLRTMKFWQDYIQYKKFRFHANMAAIKFMQELNYYKLEVCFNALKKNKETRKMKIMVQALNGDMNVAINHFTAQTNSSVNRLHTANKRRALQSFRNQMAKRLFSYFQKWKGKQEEFDSNLNRRVKDMLIRLYRQRNRAYFTNWKSNGNVKSIKKRKMMILDIQQESSAMENESITQVNEIKVKEEGVRSLRQKKQTKCIKKYINRVIQNAFDRWKDKKGLKDKMMTRQGEVMLKMNKRMLGQAWARYQEWYLQLKQHDKDLIKRDNLCELMRIKGLRKVFNELFCNMDRQQNSKKYWNRIFLRFHHFQLQLYIRTWKQQANDDAIICLRQKQAEKASQIEEASQELNRNDITISETNNEIDLLQTRLMKKAHKLIGNYLKRYYGSNTEKRFKHWKEVSIKDGQKQRIIKSTIRHMNKAKMESVRSAFKSFITQEIQKAKREAIKQVNLECESEVSVMKGNEYQISKKRERTKAVAVRAQNSQALSKKKIDKSLNIINRKACDLYVVSKKRKMFEAIRDIGKQDRRFLMSVSNVLTKSMLSKGLSCIKEASSEEHTDTQKYRHIKMMIQRFLKKNIREYLSIWKNQARGKVNNKYGETKEKYEQTTSYFKGKLTEIKDQNMQNVTHFLWKRNLKSVFVGWRNEVKIIKRLRIQTEESVHVLKAVQQKKALQKMYQRVENTRRIRFAAKIMGVYDQRRMKKAVWDAIRARRALSTHLVTSLNNLENLFHDKHRIIAFRTIQSYNNSKKYTSLKLKSISSNNIASMLTQRYEEKLRTYFGRYRAIVKAKNHRDQHIKKVINQMFGMNLRWGFEDWRKWNVKMTMKKEMNEIGPITEQVFEANRAIRNLKGFMKSENYTRDEISQSVQRCEETNDYQMRKVVKRLKIAKQDRMMARCFDHWIFWHKIKKLFKYHLRKCNDTVQPVKADLRWVFDQWKRGDQLYGDQLRRNCLARLMRKNIQQTDFLGNLAEKEAHCQASISHLSTQRNKLLDHNIRAKRLALALFHDNYVKDLRVAITRWKNYKNVANKLSGNQIINNGLQKMAKQKDFMASIEEENKKYAEENEQLRQFSFEGFEIAKTVQELSSERQNLIGEMNEQNLLVKQLLEKQHTILQGLQDLDALEDLGFDPESKFLYQTFIKLYGNGKGGAVMMDGVIREKSKERIQTQE